MLVQCIWDIPFRWDLVDWRMRLLLVRLQALWVEGLVTLPSAGAVFNYPIPMPLLLFADCLPCLRCFLPPRVCWFRTHLLPHCTSHSPVPLCARSHASVACFIGSGIRDTTILPRDPLGCGSAWRALPAVLTIVGGLLFVATLIYVHSAGTTLDLTFGIQHHCC